MKSSLLLLLGAASAFVVACSGGEASDRDAAASTEATPASGELWNTDMAYGRPIEVGATGLVRGEQAYNQNCAICHSGGVGMVGTETIQRRYMKAGITDMNPILLERTDLTPGFIELVVRNGMNSMAPYRKSEITDADLQLIGEYLSQKNPDYEGG